jgi:hypothetical protein
MLCLSAAPFLPPSPPLFYVLHLHTPSYACF